MAIVPPPTEAGYQSWIRTYMGIGTDVLPDGSVYITDSYAAAIDLANTEINCVSPLGYTTMVYNLGGAILVETAQDVQPPVIYKNDMTYFEYLRSKFGINSFVGGTIASTSDESTSESLNVPENLKNLTLQDLSLLKTPWGRVYLQWAEKYGSIWGLV